MKRNCFLLALCLGIPAWGTVYYVDSSEGNDSANGITPGSAWKSLAKVSSFNFAPGDRVLFRRGSLWRGRLTAKSGEKGKPLVYSTYGVGPKPILQNSVDWSNPALWQEERPGVWTTQSEVFGRDAGILIFDHGAKWGIKKWCDADLKSPYCYWYDDAAKRIHLRLDCNPGQLHKSIEIALNGHIISENNCHDTVYDGLTVRYTGSHGFGGGSTRNIVIRNCDIYWIGGGLQFWMKDPKTGRRTGPARFGNGIEFWGACENNLVERCRLWQIYDAALTNQTRDAPVHQNGVTYRDNVIWDSEYSFEYWNHEITARTSNILFEHNTCIDAGGSYGHTQRGGNGNGTHLMLFENPAATTNFVVRNNLFVRATNHSVWQCDDWRPSAPGVHDGLEMHHNLWWDVDGRRFFDLCQRRYWKLPYRKTVDRTFDTGIANFAKYRAEMGYDDGSVWAQPKFIDEAKRDYRLAAGSPGIAGVSTDGDCVGARNMPGLDVDQSWPVGR